MDRSSTPALRRPCAPQLAWYGQRTLDEMVEWLGVEFAHPDLVELWTGEAVERIDATSQDAERFEAIMHARTRARGRRNARQLKWRRLPRSRIQHVRRVRVPRGRRADAEILAAAMINAARFVGADEAWSSVAPGMCAGLVLLDGNPLEDADNAQRIAGVVLRGRVYERKNSIGCSTRSAAH